MTSHFRGGELFPRHPSRGARGGVGQGPKPRGGPVPRQDPPREAPGGSCSLSKSVTINGDATIYLLHAPKDLGPRPSSRPRHPSRPSYPPFPFLSPEGPRTEGRGEGSSVPGGPQNRGGGGGWRTGPHTGRSSYHCALSSVQVCDNDNAAKFSSTPLNSRHETEKCLTCNLARKKWLKA